MRTIHKKIVVPKNPTVNIKAVIKILICYLILSSYKPRAPTNKG